MAKRLTLPKNEKKFNRYAQFVNSFWRSGIIAQIISGVTAFIVYYAITKDRFGAIVGGSIAVAFVLLIELGQRSSFPAITDYFLEKSKNYIEHILGAIAIISGVAFFALSTWGSIKIVPVAVDEKVGAVVEKSTDEADLKYQEKKLEVIAAYDRETGINNDLLKSKIESNNLLYQSKIDKQKVEQKRWRYRGERENQNYTSKIKRYDIVVDKLKTERDSIESSLIAVSDNRLESLNKEHKMKLSAIDNSLLADIEKVETHNSTEFEKVVDKKSSFTGVAIFLIIICQFWAVASIVARKLFRRLAEMEEVYYPTQYYFEDTIFEKYNEAFSKWLNYKLGSFADKITSKIPDYTEARQPSVLLDYEQASQPRKRVEFEESEKETIIVASSSPVRAKSLPVSSKPVESHDEKSVAVESAPLVAERPKAMSDKGDSKIDIKYVDMKNEIDRVSKRWIRAMKKGDVEKAKLVEINDIQQILDKGFSVTYDRKKFKCSIKTKK
jgi:hypothetical protein